MKEDIEFLKELQTTLRTQDKDVQASPRFWVIGDYTQVDCLEGYEDGYKVYIPIEGFGGTLEEFGKVLDKKDEDEYWFEEYNNLKTENGNIDDWGKEDVGKFLKEYIDNESMVMPYKVEHYIEPDTMFITKAEAMKHIDKGKNLYTEGVHTYAMTATDAPTVSRLWDILENIDWDSVDIK